MLTLTNLKTKDKLALSTFTVDLSDKFKAALGKDPANSRYYCDEETTSIWPLRFSVIIHGTVEMAKEGYLLATLSGSYIYEKTGVLRGTEGGFRIRLTRASTEQELSGFVIHESLTAMIREKEATLHKPILNALLAAITVVKKDEEIASSAHAARARVAEMVHKTVKQG